VGAACVRPHIWRETSAESPLRKSKPMTARCVDVL
jgi:hypothetical protein